jgi:hypothetical protein
MTLLHAGQRHGTNTLTSDSRCNRQQGEGPMQHGPKTSPRGTPQTQCKKKYAQADHFTPTSDCFRAPKNPELRPFAALSPPGPISAVGDKSTRTIARRCSQKDPRRPVSDDAALGGTSGDPRVPNGRVAPLRGCRRSRLCPTPLQTPQNGT